MVVIGQTGPKNVNYGVVDVSWPNCKQTKWNQLGTGIIGVSGGLDFHANRCLSREKTWFENYAFYLNTGYPGPYVHRSSQASPKQCHPKNYSCMAYNYGYNAGVYDINYARASGVYSNLWWLDVETDNSWTASTTVNQAAIKGMIAAIKAKALFPVIGVYSYKDQWNIITGKWHNHLPVWSATGGLKPSDARAACREKSFTGGPVWLGQYTNKLDINLNCSTAFNYSVTHQFL